MSKKPNQSAQSSEVRRFSRRNFLKLGGGALAGLMGAYMVPGSKKNILLPADVAEAATYTPTKVFVGTDGWIGLPPSPAIPPYHPDNLAPAPFTTYIFGFRDVTGLSESLIFDQATRAQHSAPLFWVNENEHFILRVYNLGMPVRPDLFDSHTVHWHGFKDQIPFFDGEPTSSISIPIGRFFDYLFIPHDPGTYMYHCHVEDVEHVHMGMTGQVFVRPAQDGTSFEYPPGSGKSYSRFAYNDGDGSTGYDREFSMFLSEVWAEAHWCDAHIQLPEWTDYHPDFSLLNGRVYPDTLAPNGAGRDPATGDLLATPGYEHLQYQPISSLIQCNAGDRVLLRVSSLGFKLMSMTLAGIKMRVVGRDANMLRGRDGTDLTFETNTLMVGAGEAYDAIFEAPPVTGPGPDTYLFYNRAYIRSGNLDGSGYGGQMTEIRVYPAGTLPPQTAPNT